MDKWGKNDQQKAFKRSSDIEVSKRFKEAIERAAIMHLNAGHMDEYMIAMNTLNKIDTVNAIQEQQDALTDKVEAQATRLEGLIDGLGGTGKEE